MTGITGRKRKFTETKNVIHIKRHKKENSISSREIGAKELASKRKAAKKSVEKVKQRKRKESKENVGNVKVSEKHNRIQENNVKAVVKICDLGKRFPTKVVKIVGHKVYQSLKKIDDKTHECSIVIADETASVQIRNVDDAVKFNEAVKSYESMMVYVEKHQARKPQNSRNLGSIRVVLQGVRIRKVKTKEEHLIPKSIRFNFVQRKDFKTNVGINNVDFIGLVKHDENVPSKYGKGTSRKVWIGDETGATGVFIKHEDEDSLADQVIVIKNAELKAGKNDDYVNLVNGFVIAGHMVDRFCTKQKVTLQNNKEKIGKRFDPKDYRETELLAFKTSLNELEDTVWSQREQFGQVRLNSVKIEDFLNDNNMVYRVKKGSKKLLAKRETDGLSSEQLSYCYRLELEISDGRNEEMTIDATSFDEVSKQLMGVSAEEFRNASEEKQSELMGKAMKSQWNMYLRSKVSTYKSRSRVKTVLVNVEKVEVQEDEQTRDFLESESESTEDSESNMTNGSDNKVESSADIVVEESVHDTLSSLGSARGESSSEQRDSENSD